jgi:hypothetical protein
MTHDNNDNNGKIVARISFFVGQLPTKTAASFGMSETIVHV